MIDIALKHWIYELCIDQLFNGIQKNFTFTTRDIYTCKKGDTFRKIVAYADLDMGDGRGTAFYTFTDCVITQNKGRWLDFKCFYVEDSRNCKPYMRHHVIHSFEK